MTHSFSKVTTGYTTAVQVQAGAAYQLGHNFGTNIERFTTDDSWSTESGVGISATKWSVSYTGQWTF